uniref:Uncharacterized protein n=1 Tax=viral metagenome TaxID=1070528 RepID=A0A6M3LK05_9ZZZZ
MDKEKAEAHWEYTEGLIRLMFEMMLELMKYQSIACLLHGAKHERENPQVKE